MKCWKRFFSKVFNLRNMKNEIVYLNHMVDNDESVDSSINTFKSLFPMVSDSSCSYRFTNRELFEYYFKLGNSIIAACNLKIHLAMITMISESGSFEYAIKIES